MSRTKRNLIPLLLVMAALAGLLMTTAFAEGDAEYVSNFFAQPLSLLPPVLAIALALITKEVYTSLFLGCLVGGFLYANFNPVVAVTSVYDTIASKVGDNMGIVVFLVSLGFIVVLMNRSGGSKAYGDWAKKVIKTRRGALLATMILALVLGVDDYFNNLTTGNVMRPVTDGHQISRAKLAYMIDSTAAPVCIMMPISSWAAAVSGVAESMEGVSGLQLFISAIPWNYYAILTIFTLIILAVFDEDFGPMKVHEDNAKRGDIYTTPERPYADADDESKNSANGKVVDLVIPVIVLIISCVSGLLFTGGFFTPDSGTYMNVMDAFANCSAASGLMYGSFIVVIFCFIYFLVIRRSMSFVQVTDCIAEGFKVMVPAILILTFAWTISGVTNDLLGAKFFVEEFMKAYAADLANLLPAVIFLVSVLLAFATGTSWGTWHPDPHRGGHLRRGRRHHPHHRPGRLPGRRRLRRPLLPHLRYHHPGLHRRSVLPPQPREDPAALCPDGGCRLLCELHPGRPHPERDHQPRPCFPEHVRGADDPPCHHRQGQDGRPGCREVRKTLSLHVSDPSRSKSPPALPVGFCCAQGWSAGGL